MLAAAAAYLSPGLGRWLNLYDEGLMAYGAVRVMDGQAPYRDFWAMYGPAQFYVLAGLFRLFEPSIAVERLWDVAVRACLALAVFLVAARLSSKKLAALSWLLSVVWLEYFGFYGYPIFAGLLFVMLSLYCLLRSFDQPAWLWPAGVLAGVAGLFRHDLAAYVIAAQAIALAGRALARPPEAGPAAPGWLARLRAGLRRALPFLAGLAAVALPAALLLALTAPVGEMIQQLLVFPATVFPRMRDLPYPPLTGQYFPFYFPFGVYALGAVLAVIQHRSAASDGADRAWGLAAVILFGLFGFNQANVRSDLIHIPQFFLPAVAILPALATGFKPVLARSWRWAAVPVLLLAASLAVPPILNYIDAFPQQPPAWSGLPRAGRVQLPREQLAVAQFLQRMTQPDDRIYSGVGRHDRVFVNDVMLYFLAERHSATRYHELHPGVATTLPVQQEIAADLERHAVKYVVLLTMFDEVSEPNDSAMSSGVTFLDDYIRSRYRLSVAFGPYQVLARR
jgi:hypothetical protein